MTENSRTQVSPCAKHEEDLVLLHYGDLTGAERDTLQTHVHNCTACAGYLRDLGMLLPLTIVTDEPAQSFWTDYDRELRRKIDNLGERTTWKQTVRNFFRPPWVPAFATAAVVALALTFTMSRDFWSSSDPAKDAMVILELMPVAENLEFYNAMEVLDNLDLLESMGKQSNAA